ncbi:MAG: M4 family metallopeptidase [Bacteroidia bacterium]|nr:M4 family metallopeptidase [Bacteroidia bacterium]
MRITTLFLILTSSISVFAQSSWKPGTNAGWYEVGAQLTPAKALADATRILGLSSEVSWQLIETRYDELGFEHEYYEMIYDGYPVDLSRLVLHWQGAILTRAYAFAPRIHARSGAVPVSAVQASSLALQEIDAEEYYWEHPELEVMRKQITGNANASYAPSPQLVWADTDFDWKTEVYRLAWKMEVFSTKPLNCELIYIDATTGAVLKRLSQTQHENVPGTAKSRYRNTLPIISDSTGAKQFRLRDYSRASQGIVTLDLNNSTSLSSAVDFENDSSHWDLTNANWDEASADVHWGSEQAYDVFLNNYSFDSFDGKGGQIRSYVHYGPKNYNNAFWNVDHAGYGDYQGNPNVGLDIVGHEMTHGVIRNTANLIYFDEGAALNEGYADIFGNTIEALKDSAGGSWLVGEDSDAIRNMANPRSIIYGFTSQGHPDTYRGQGWYTGTLDNGGAHGNSAVFSHWYYLLAEGGTGTNDNGEAYAVSGIGVLNAGQIAWRMLGFYLTPTAQFADAREAAMLSAQDLFGACSAQWQAVVNAWHAVGLGQPVLDNDLGMINVQTLPTCRPDAMTPVVAYLKNFGCSAIPATSLQVIYTLKNPLTVGVEVITLPNGLAPGEVMEVNFAQTLNMSLPRDYAVTSTSLYLSDSYQPNNESSPTVVQVRVPMTGGTGMESPFVMDTLALSDGSQSSITLDAASGNNGTKGIKMEGGNGNSYRLVDAFPMWGGPPVDVFDYNDQYSSQLCFCADEAGPVLLQFDRRQTYSTALASRLQDQFPGQNHDSLMSKYGSVLRVLADGTELARYFPTSINQDPWTLEEVDLSAYAGAPVQICFEGKTIWSKAQDPRGVGDKILLDNLYLKSLVSGIGERREEIEAEIRMGTDSREDKLHLELAAGQVLTVRVLDLRGKELSARSLFSSGSAFEIPLMEKPLAAGVYLIQIREAGRSKTLRWMVR